MYLEAAEFRLEMEMEAHIKEYRVYCLRHKDSRDRASYLELIGERLSGKMYGEVITKENAMSEVAAGRRLK